MNKQRKVLITVTYNEMGIIIDTKAEEVARPILQPTCNQLATDCISRKAALNTVQNMYDRCDTGSMQDYHDLLMGAFEILPSVDAVEVVRCKDCKWYKTNFSWNGKEHKVCVIEPYEPVRKCDDFCKYGVRKDG